jgi:rod shape-determining protein MreD
LYYIISLVLLVLCVALQHAWPPWLQFGGVAPELTLVAVISVGLLRGSTVGCAAGFIGAFLSASTGAQPMGTMFVTHIAAGFGAGLLAGRLFSTRITVAALGALIAVIVHSLITLIFAPPAEPQPWVRLVINKALWTAVWSLVVYLPFRTAANLLPEEGQEY